ncbi:MAG: hypothetical protein ACR2MZ_12490 [Candidatus Dormibacter sp.]|uniref:hypothetical protein n=1 Tax=Candidatus Dormibacter sp. TaxID=2973982 RepID=UPI000DB031C7|nr:MAG: hypothetical protein DLM66_10860 [Candidatus Dormibacteraeota bacterium]
MTQVQINRAAGIGLLVSATVAGVADVLQTLPGHQATATVTVAGALVAFLGNLFVIICLPVAVGRQAQRAGILGVAGYVLLALVILVFGVASDMANALLIPNLPPAIASRPPGGLIVT